ncbi:MAG TPA: enolase C-terminal domain-like protein [Planctomycetia bacterium]|jgi:muconate cycloisomerase|nr:enolase C-terminal domain-like protein [Planctomycetia bacterium]
MISTRCPKCGVNIRVDEKYVGKRGRCSKCGEVFTFGVETGQTMPLPQSALPGRQSAPTVVAPLGDNPFANPFTAAPPPVAEEAPEPAEAPQPADAPTGANRARSPFDSVEAPRRAPPSSSAHPNPFASWDDPIIPPSPAQVGEVVPEFQPIAPDPYNLPLGTAWAQPPSAEPTFTPLSDAAASAPAAPPRRPPAERRIDTVEVYVARLTCKENYATAAGMIFRAGKNTNRILVKLVDNHGDATGWGEANPQAPMTGDGLEGTLAKLRRYLRPVLEGAAVGDADAIFRRMDKAIAPTPAGALAKSAIEAALADLWSRTLEIPLYLMLGGKRIARPQLAYTVGADTPEGATNGVGAGKEQGFVAFHLRVFGGAESKERATLDAFAKAIGPGTHWTVSFDGVQALDIAARHVRLAGKLGAHAVRPPLRGSRLTAYARLVRLGAAPIAVEEPLQAAADVFEFARAEAIDLAVLRPTRLGLKQTLRMHGAAEAAGLRAGIALSGESDIGLAHALHLASALNLDFPIEGAGRQFVETPYLAEPLVWKDGRIALPDGPGLGVSVDPEQLGAIAVEQ